MKRLDDQNSLTELIHFTQDELRTYLSEQRVWRMDEHATNLSKVASALTRYRILLRHVDDMEEMVEVLSYGQDVQDMEAILRKINRTLVYDPNFGDDIECACGHSYYRHFDWAENNAPVGCKYCGCFNFSALDVEIPC